MAGTQKVSISIGSDELQWAKARAKKQRTSLSAVMTDAVRFRRQMDARQRFLERLEPSERATASEVAELLARWQG